jgi:adenylyltransferase/sulfurtransferase
MLTPRELLRYSRQVLLPEIHVSGQEKIIRSSVLVIGAGGLGSPALFYLAAAGVGRIGIVDFDLVEESNLQRQILFRTDDIGQEKAAVAGRRITELNPLVTVETHPVRLTAANALEILGRYDVIVDGSDNLPTRYLVNDAAVLLGKCLIYGAIFQFEGQVSVFNQQLADGSRGPNYRDLFPEPPPPEMVPSCNESGVLGVLPGIIGSMQANEAIKVIVGTGTSLSGRLMIFDSLDFSTHFLKLNPRPNNPISGENPSIRQLIDYEAFCNPTAAGHEVPVREISPSEVKTWMDSGKAFQLIDVREPLEYEIVHIGGVNIPLFELPQKAGLIQNDIPVVIHCQSGKRSLKALLLLQKTKPFNNLYNMTGGLLRWKEEVDKGMLLG